MLLLRGWKAHDISSAAILSSITLIHFPAAMSQTLAVASNETDKMTSLDNEKTKSVEKKQNQFDISKTLSVKFHFLIIYNRKYACFCFFLLLKTNLKFRLITLTISKIKTQSCIQSDYILRIK